MGIDIESFSSTSPTDPSDPRHSHTASVAGFWIKKGTCYDWLNCLQHDPSSTVTPTSFNDPSTPKHLLLSFLLKSNNFIQQEFSEFTWPADNGTIFFQKENQNFKTCKAPSGIDVPYVSNPLPIFSLLPQVSPRWSARTARPLRYRRLGIVHWTIVDLVDFCQTFLGETSIFSWTIYN